MIYVPFLRRKPVMTRLITIRGVVVMARYKDEFDSPAGIRKILKAIWVQLKNDDINVQKAKALSSIAYQMLGTIMEERKAEEVEALQALKEKLDKLGG